MVKISIKPKSVRWKGQWEVKAQWRGNRKTDGEKRIKKIIYICASSQNYFFLKKLGGVRLLSLEIIGKSPSIIN